MTVFGPDDEGAPLKARKIGSAIIRTDHGNGRGLFDAHNCSTIILVIEAATPELEAATRAELERCGAIVLC